MIVCTEPHAIWTTYSFDLSSDLVIRLHELFLPIVLLVLDVDTDRSFNNVGSLTFEL